MAREMQGERVPLLAREGEAPRLRVRDDGAAKASRQAVIICGNRHAYSSAVVLFAVFASP